MSIRDRDKDEGRYQRDSTGQHGGGKKVPDDSDDSDGSKDSVPTPPHSNTGYPGVWEEDFGDGIDSHRQPRDRL